MARPIDADGFLDRNAEFANREFIHPKYQVTLRELVDSEPTLSPDDARGVGKWIRISGYHLDREYHPARYQCDQCKHFIDSGDDRNYCPNCGAKMEVSEDTRKN